MVHTIPYSARISDTVFPSAPPVRKISGGSHFLTLHRVEEIDNVIEEYKQNIKTDKREEEIGAVFASNLSHIIRVLCVSVLQGQLWRSTFTVSMETNRPLINHLQFS